MSRFLSDGAAKHTADDLKEMQAWDLDRKILVTQTRIIEWYKVWHGDVYVSFSGGKDSTVLLDIARRVFPDIPAVFVDTGLEFPEIREFVKTIPNVTWLKPKMNFRKVIETYGYPVISKDIAECIQWARTGSETRLKRLSGTLTMKDGNPSMFNCPQWKFMLDAPFLVSAKCCNVMKKAPAKEFHKRTGLKPIIGMMACESLQRKNAWLKTGCNAFSKKDPQSQPMAFWTEQDVLAYIQRYHIPYASVYGDIVQDEHGQYYTTGCHRTGCVFCGFGVHREKEPNRFQRLKITHPQLWEYCMKPWNRGGLGMQEVLEFIGVKTE